MQRHAHQFLISMPNQSGSYFGDTLIYLVRHDDEGAFGLVVNRTLSLSVVDMLGQLDIAASAVDPDLMTMDGGPVEPERGFILHTNDVELDSSEDAGPGLAMSLDRRILDAIGRGDGPRHYLVALGYAGWAPEQLDDELRAGAWLTCPHSTDVLWDAPPETRLHRVADSMGVDLKLLSSDAGLA